MGRHMLRLLRYAIRYPNCWNLFTDSNREARAALYNLARKDLLIIKQEGRKLYFKANTQDTILTR